MELYCLSCGRRFDGTKWVDTDSNLTRRVATDKCECGSTTFSTKPTKSFAGFPLVPDDKLPSNQIRIEQWVRR